MTPREADRRDPARRFVLGGAVVLVLAMLAGGVLAGPRHACGPESAVFVELAEAGWRPPVVLEPLGAGRWREAWTHRDRAEVLPVVNAPGDDGRLRCVLFPEPRGDR